jgi:hypothetical protein
VAYDHRVGGHLPQGGNKGLGKFHGFMIAETCKIEKPGLLRCPVFRLPLPLERS